MLQASIILPCYNEEKRMRPFLNGLLKYNNPLWEFIFVNDGSKDNTLNIMKSYGFNNKKIISYKKNRGKGYAVRSGVIASRADKAIFIDVEGSIHPSQIRQMVRELDHYDVVVGDRTLKESKMVSPSYRKFTGISFNIISRILFNIKNKDSLCGFKGFRRKTIKNLFGNLISERWAFDVEIFYKIKKYKYSLLKMPIHWEHREGSKIFNAFEIIKVFISLFLLRLRLL